MATEVDEPKTDRESGPTRKKICVAAVPRCRCKGDRELGWTIDLSAVSCPYCNEAMVVYVFWPTCPPPGVDLGTLVYYHGRLARSDEPRLARLADEAQMAKVVAKASAAA